MFVQTLWKLLETVHYWWQRTDSSPSLVVYAIFGVLAGMLFPLFQTASIALECRRIEPNEGTCDIVTRRPIGGSSVTVSIQDIKYAEAVRVDSTDDDGNPQTCWRVDLNLAYHLEDARSVPLTTCRLSAGEAQNLRSSVGNFLNTPTRPEYSYIYIDSNASFLGGLLVFPGIAFFVGIASWLLFKIVRQKKATPMWRDKPIPSLPGILFALGIAAACMLGITALAANSFSYGPLGPTFGPVTTLIAVGIFAAIGVGAAGYLAHSLLAWMIFRQSAAEASARVKRSSKSTTDEYGEKHTRYKLTLRFKADLPDGTMQPMQVEIPVNYNCFESCPEDFVVRYAQLDPHIFLLPGE